MNIEINSSAPVISKKTITIFAPAGVVWEVLTRINNWPDWQKNVKEAILEGPLKEGTAFNWKAGGISFSSEIHTMKPDSEFGWTGRTMGAYAVHNWWLEKKGGATRVTVEESLEGFLPYILRKYFRKILEEGMQTQLVELKITSETIQEQHTTLL